MAKGAGMCSSSARRVLVVLFTLTLLAGCATKGQTGAAVGGLTGAALGAAVGAAIGGRTGAAIGGAAGAGVGVALGALIGNRLDARDKAAREAAVRDSLDSTSANRAIAWVNPDTGNSGTLTPVTTSPRRDLQQGCREFEETFTREGNTYTKMSRACLRPDGTWAMQD